MDISLGGHSFSTININKHVSSMGAKILVSYITQLSSKPGTCWKLNEWMNEWCWYGGILHCLLEEKVACLEGKLEVNSFMIKYHDYLSKITSSISLFPWYDREVFEAFMLLEMQNYHMVMYKTDKICEVWKALIMYAMVPVKAKDATSWSNTGDCGLTSYVFSVEGKPIYIIWVQNLTPF